MGRSAVRAVLKGMGGRGGLTGIGLSVLLGTAALLPGDSSRAQGARDEGVIRMHPETSEEVLINPGTGWQLLVSGPPRGEMQRLPLVSTYYYRACWTQFEPEPGQYEGSPAVRVIDAWLTEARRHNRYVAIRVVPWNSRNPGYQRACAQKVQGYDSPVPAYIFEAGAKGFPEPGSSGAWVPVFWDPIYLEHHRRLAAFLGTRYGGDPNVAYVDVPSGNYGEMNLTNTGVRELDDLSKWREYGLSRESWSAMLRELASMYRAAFPADLLVAARDYAYYEGGREALTDLIEAGVGFRDDGLGMSYCGPGRENREYEDNWTRVLCLYENGYGSWLDWGDQERVRATLDWAIDRTRASIVMVGKGAAGEESYRHFLPLVEEYGRRLGYRLVVEGAEWRASVHRGDVLAVALTWRNLGNAPPYMDLALSVALEGNERSRVASHLVGPDAVGAKRWVPGESYALRVEVPVPGSLRPGSYRLAISLFEPLPGAEGEAGVRRRIQLGMKGGHAGWYPLGEVRIR